MKFWRISAPDYTSDYQDSYINGSIESQLFFPAIDCDLCMMTWGWSGLRSLPFECPESLRDEMSTINSRHNLLCEDHVKLQGRVLEEANVHGESFVNIRPGYRFPPLSLDIPSRPRADFLWPFGGLLVSRRVRDLLVDVCQDDVATFPVVMRKVGRRNAKLPAFVPATGEPEDIINEAPLLDNPSGVGPYYEVIPRHASDELPDRIESECSTCGRVKTKVVDPGTRMPMAKDRWHGRRIFYQGETLHIVVTEDVKKALQDARPSNLLFSEVPCS